MIFSIKAKLIGHHDFSIKAKLIDNIETVLNSKLHVPNILLYFIDTCHGPPITAK